MVHFSSTGKSVDQKYDLQAELNLLVMQSIAPVSVWVGILYFVFAISHFFVLPKSIASTMSLLAGGTALILLGVYIATKQQKFDIKHAHLVAVGMISMVFINTFIHILLTHDILQTTNLMLVLVGAGFFILSTRWFLLCISIGVIGWILFVTSIPTSDNIVHFIFGVFTACVLSIIIHYVRQQTIRKLVQTRAEVQRNLLELSILNSIVVSITSSLEPDRVFQKIVDAVPYLMENVNGATLQVLEGRDKLVTRAWSQSIQPEALTFRVGEGISGVAVSEKRIMNISDVDKEPRFVKGLQKPNFHSLLSMPLFIGEKVIGVISVEDSKIGSFDAESERKLQILANYAAVAIENSRLFHQHLLAEETLKNYTDHLQEVVEARTSELKTAQDKIFAQKQLEQDIELARQVQENLLAQETPQIYGFEFAATGLPARYVGGDFYDFIEKDSHCNIILADISGKGVSAAMLTSTARTLIRTAINYETEPALILSNLQDAIYPDLSHAEMFGTFFAASLDPKVASLTYANAGHTETLWWQHKTQQIATLSSTALPIGIFPNSEISQNQILLCPGDILVFYSDGVTEAMNPQEELFNINRLKEILQKNAQESAYSLSQTILVEVNTFTNGAPLIDDLTLVILRVTPRTTPFQFQIDMQTFDQAVQFIRQQVEPYGVDFAYQVELALSEIITNITKHAYREKSGKLSGEVLLEENKILINLYDDGEHFDSQKLPEIDFNEVHSGGYGLHIVHQIMDEVEYTRNENNQNHWRIVKYIQKGK